MAGASASSRFLLIIFLQLLRSTTTSPTASSAPDDSKLPLIVFQQHHHHRGGGQRPPHLAGSPSTPDLTTVVPPPPPPPTQDDYYAYNVAAAGSGSDDDVTDQLLRGGTSRKHHFGGGKDSDDGTDDDDELFPAPVKGKKHHHFASSNSNSGEFTKGMRTLYQVGDSDDGLPECGAWSVCGKVDVYEPSRPWLEKQCRCPANGKGTGTRRSCSDLLSSQDGHTVVDKTRHYKVCEPVRRLPKCRYFRDVTWTLRTTAENGTQQTMHCLCPRGAVAYLIKRQAYQTSNNAIGYQYSFACSPQSRLRCQRKEPCRLFTVRKRQELLDEVNTNTLCQCPHGHTCPSHHTQQPGVVQGKTYLEENVRTYSGYCLPEN